MLGGGDGDELMVAVDGGGHGQRTADDGGWRKTAAVGSGLWRTAADVGNSGGGRCRCKRMAAEGVAVVWMIYRIKFYVGGCY